MNRSLVNGFREPKVTLLLYTRITQEAMTLSTSDDQQKQAIVQQFGARADHYVTSASHKRGGDLARLIERLAPTSTECALDVATGGGHVALALAARAGQVVASDLTPAMLAVARNYARSQGHTDILYVAGDAETLPFAEESFDIVTCRIAAHHFLHPQRFLAEVVRVLRVGGRFGFTDNVSPDDPVEAEFINVAERLRDPTHVCCQSIRVWCDWFDQCGLRIEWQEHWHKTLVFDEWMARATDDAEQRARVTRHVLSAAAPLLETFLVERDGDQVCSLTTTQWLAIATKVGPPSERREEELGSEERARSHPSSEGTVLADARGHVDRHTPGIVGLDHMQLAAPPGCEDLARTFYGERLGLQEVPKPAELQGRGGVWFQCQAGQLHIGVEPAFQPSRKAHPAFIVTLFEAYCERLETAGIAVVRDDLPGVRRAFLYDPFGNRLELVDEVRMHGD